MKRSSPLIALSLLICVSGIRIVYAQPGLNASILHLSQAQEPKPFPLQRSDEKVISRHLFVNDPVDIDNLSVKGVKIELNRKFSASSIANEGGGLEEDWLENLAFSVINKTEKRITYMLISFQFPLFTEDPHSQAGIYYHIVLGVDPRATGTAATYAEPFSLAAGDSHTIMLVDKDLNEIKKRLAKLPLADFNKMFILIPTVGYEDGTQWKLGKDSRPEKVQQSDDKEIEIASYDNEPYEIGDLTVKNVKLHPGWSYPDSEESFVRRIKESYKFSARSVKGDGGGQEEDWLENLQFSVKNNSDKQVNYIGLSIQFPETTVNGPLMVDNSLNLGIRPSDTAEWTGKKTPLSLAPGDSITFTLSAQNLKLIKDFLAHRKFQLSGLNKAVIRMEEIYYLGDSIMWWDGSYYRPSTTTPGRYERIDK